MSVAPAAPKKTSRPSSMRTATRGKPGAKAKGSRALRVEATRKALINAATEVIGEVGYARASIARITSRAKVAQGTFYTYFKSRQHLFDHLLPDVGKDMLASIAHDMHGAHNLIEVEERGFRSLFRYVAEHPGFYRLLNEAETLAPRAHSAHFRNLTDGYRNSLQRAKNKGELKAYSDQEVDALVYMLMGIRSYLILGFARRDKTIRPLPEWVTRTYLKFVGAALGLESAK
jgi:AcrR family transcriptional regulator